MKTASVFIALLLVDCFLAGEQCILHKGNDGHGTYASRYGGNE